MANTIHLISKEFLNPADVADRIRKSANKLNNRFSIDDDGEIINIRLVKLEVMDFLDIFISDQPEYNDTFNNLFNISNYGSLITIDYGYNDVLLIPFLREMLLELPELLVYNEEVSGDIGSYIFNKEHLDSFSGTDVYGFFNTPPKGLDNLV